MLHIGKLSPKASATRIKILESSAALFWRRSYHGVSVDEIAATTGVNMATIYRYFPDKAAIGLEIATLHGERIISGMFGQIFANHSGPAERLQQIYKAMICAHQTQYDEEADIFGCPITGLVLELGYELPEVRRKAADIFDRVEDFFREIALDAIDLGTVDGWSAQALARTLMQLLHGALVSARLAASPEPVGDAGNASLALIGSPLRLSIPTGENS